MDSNKVHQLLPICISKEESPMLINESNALFSSLIPDSAQTP
ncbi:hypothetical protein [Desulfogranum marinum]|jgi:hypothetical protein|nr:hypothetical protein [Desulfogranum marinum]